MIVRADMTSKGDRRGRQTICRMMGSKSQSYVLAESMEFGAAREMYDGLTDRARHEKDLGLGFGPCKDEVDSDRERQASFKKKAETEEFDRPMSGQNKD